MTAHKFDCSNMSGLLAKILQEKGFHVRIAMSMEHAWLLVKTKEGVQEVEATSLYRMPIGEPALLTLHPGLIGLVAFTGQYKYSDDQYTANLNGNATDGYYTWLTSETVYYSHRICYGNDTAWGGYGNLTVDKYP